MRHDYGETRQIALGNLEGRMHVLCFTETSTGIRVISFRRANAREIRRYEKSKPLVDDEGEVRELLVEDLRKFRPLPEVVTPRLRRSWVF